MDNQKRKALYIFLSSMLGIMLFLMLHRSLFVIYEILSNLFPDNTVFRVDPAIYYTTDFFTMLVAMFLGGWYGVWLGLDWYKLIYEEREGRQWFHGFLPHHWRNYGSGKKKSVESSSVDKTVPKHFVVKSPSIFSSPRIESFASFRRAPKPPEDTAWSFDEVASSSDVAISKRKGPTKKRTTKKKA